MAEPSQFPLLPAQVLSERFHLIVPSLPSWIEPTVEYLKQRALLCGACQPTRAGKLVVALHEALSNSLLHGNLELSSELKEQGPNHFAETLARRANDPLLAGRLVDIVGHFDGDVCQWTFTDQGNGFDVDAVLTRCLNSDATELLSSGRGILMMKSFLDDVRYELGGRRVVMSLRRRSGEEKRRDPRVPLTLSFQVTPIMPDGTVSWSETYEAVSLNFSEHGMSLLQTQSTHTARLLIGIPSDEEIVYVPAEVKHVRPLGTSGVELGCVFTHPLGQETVPPRPTADVPLEMEEVQQAISKLLEDHQPQQTVPHERRVHPRVVFNESVLVHQENRADVLTGFARDLSKGGIAFIVQVPLAGEFIIWFSLKEGEAPLKVRCRVVRCGRIKDGLFDVGAVFLGLDSTGTEKR
jgi:Histidine kinase-like ATPase domain/PilZ domain